MRSVTRQEYQFLLLKLTEITSNNVSRKKDSAAFKFSKHFFWNGSVGKVENVAINNMDAADRAV